MERQHYVRSNYDVITLGEMSDVIKWRSVRSLKGDQWRHQMEDEIVCYWLHLLRLSILFMFITRQSCSPLVFFILRSAILNSHFARGFQNLKLRSPGFSNESCVAQNDANIITIKIAILRLYIPQTISLRYWNPSSSQCYHVKFQAIAKSLRL